MAGNGNGTGNWQANFEKRCLAVGWQVEMSANSHYKVRDAAGKYLFTYSGTPSDPRSMKNTLAEAKRHGLLELETQAKLAAEKERLERIERDRAAADAQIAASNSRAVANVARGTPDLGQVAGVAIVMSGPAMYKSPLMDKAGPIAFGEELLLADDRTVFRCLKPAATNYRPDLEGICHKIYDTVGSLRTHIGYHSRKPAGAEPNGEEGSSVTKLASKPEVVTQRDKPTAKLAERVDELSTAVVDMIENLQDMTLRLSSIQHDIAKLEVADEATIEKARQFDVLQGIFQGKSK